MKIILVMVLLLSVSALTFADQALVEVPEVTEEPETIELDIVQERPTTAWGLMAGAYYPTSPAVREVYGSGWIRIGVRPIPVDFAEYWRPTWDVNYYGMRTLFGNRVSLIPITGGVLRGFRSESDSPVYFGVNAGACYIQVRSPHLNIYETGWAPTLNASLGITFNERFSLEGRYEFVNRFHGLDFSAFTISATFKAFETRF